MYRGVARPRAGGGGGGGLKRKVFPPKSRGSCHRSRFFQGSPLGKISDHLLETPVGYDFQIGKYIQKGDRDRENFLGLHFFFARGLGFRRSEFPWPPLLFLSTFVVGNLPKHLLAAFPAIKMGIC